VSLLYYSNVVLHVLAAMFWLGGMFFLGLVGAPALRRVEAPLRARLFEEIGVRFRSAGWIAIAVLLATGAANLHFRGLLTAATLGDAFFWGTGYGRMLAVKLATVTVMVALSAVHDFGIGPAAGRAQPGSAEAARLRRWASWLGRINALMGLLLVIAAVRIAR
jgi:uncharacterized membrane protein